ncbi:MAG TPA: response regulator, partial [bacterium]|nr:response regulator [bacterium]
MRDTKVVLLIDDDVDFLASNRLLFESEGFSVVTCSDGDEGLEKAKTCKPAVIVLDVMMKTSTEGFHLAKQLRSLQETKSVPIVMLTGVNQHAPFKFEAEDTWLPVDKFLEKPVAASQLLAEVKAVI